MHTVRMAFDRSLRRVDVDGRLHVEQSNISKATVSPYLGEEIPNFEGLGLSPTKVYYLFRDPEEIAKAVQSFDNIPLLKRHVPVYADDYDPALIVGSTGTDGVFEYPYLKNSLVIWDAEARVGVDTKQQTELSSAYRYRADMTPGVHNGVRFDGVMRDLIGNHVALVEVGRAGPDVVVADSSPFHGVTHMSKLSRTALAVVAAVGAITRPRLAADAKLPSLDAAMAGVTGKTLKPEALAVTLVAAIKPALAQDAELSTAELQEIISAAVEGVDDNPAMDADEDDETDEDGKPKKKLAADDLPDPSKEDAQPKDKPAMDAALKNAENQGAAKALAQFRAIRQAEIDVAPHIGAVVAMDSAEAVYKMALDAAKINTDGMDPSAYRHVVANMPKPGQSVVTSKPAIALDAKGESFADLFPNAVRPLRS